MNSEEERLVSATFDDILFELIVNKFKPEFNLRLAQLSRESISAALEEGDFNQA